MVSRWLQADLNLTSMALVVTEEAANTTNSNETPCA